MAAGVVYRQEGADDGRVLGVVRLLSGMGMRRIEEELAAGRSFPVPASVMGTTLIPGVMISPATVQGLTPEAEALMRRIDLLKVVAGVKAKAAKLVGAAKVSAQ